MVLVLLALTVAFTVASLALTLVAALVVTVGGMLTVVVKLRTVEGVVPLAFTALTRQ